MDQTELDDGKESRNTAEAMRAGYTAMEHTVLWLCLTVSHRTWFVTRYNTLYFVYTSQYLTVPGLIWLCLTVAHRTWFVTRYSTLYFGYSLL
jgi:hypothetical protein